MKLTKKEKAICKKYSARDEKGLVHCNECPLSIGNTAEWDFTCYANIDGRTAEARALKRLLQEMHTKVETENNAN